MPTSAVEDGSGFTLVSETRPHSSRDPSDRLKPLIVGGIRTALYIVPTMSAS